MGGQAATRRWGMEADAIEAAAAMLREGGLVAFPTETVYGLGADARSGQAVARIYAAKGRPRFNPLIAHVAERDQATREGRFTPAALRLAEAFWPGPLTLVVPMASGCTVCDLARAGLPSVALRVPSHPIAAAILRSAGVPIAAPSANRSGRISPTTAEHVLDDLDGRVDGVLDGGPTQIGVESTIVSCLDDAVHVLRPGGITREAIEMVLGLQLAPTPRGETLLAPGGLASHYAPRASLRLHATAVMADEAVLDFGGRFAHAACVKRLDLSPSGDLAEAAANLFGHLHRLDAAAVTRIAVAPVSSQGLGEALNDRLARAAAPRP